MTVNRIAAGAAVCCAVMFAAACGGGTAATGTAGASPSATSSAGGGDGTVSGARAFPGATGLLAQIDGTTLQVQSTDAQTAVTYTTATTFTDTVAARLSDVVVGVCVQARSARPTRAAGTSPTAAPRATTGPIMAASIEISAAVNGQCSALGGLGIPGTRPQGGTGDATPPSGTPNPTRTRGPGAGGNGFGGNGFGGPGAFGKVTAVNGASFTLESSRPQEGSATATATTAVPTIATVQTSAATTYTQTRAASAKALAVGLCVTAVGKSSDTGSIAATSIMLRPTENGSCSSQFDRRGPGGSGTPTGGGSGV